MPSASLGCHQDTELLEISLINLSKCGWVGGWGGGGVLYIRQQNHREGRLPLPNG